LNTAEAAYQNALADYNRFENAVLETKQQLDQTKLNLVTSKSRLQAKVNVGDTNIKSTINGIVNKSMVQFSVGTPMFEIVNVSKLKLKVSIKLQV
jgi:multidrug resistance efflux pump